MCVCVCVCMCVTYVGENINCERKRMKNGGSGNVIDHRDANKQGEIKSRIKRGRGRWLVPKC